MISLSCGMKNIVIFVADLHENCTFSNVDKFIIPKLKAFRRKE